MSSSNSCFLTCTQISQDAGKVIWYSYLLKNCPQFVMIYAVKVFSIVNETEVDIFLEFSFSMIQQILVIWSLVPLPFLNPACISGSSLFKYCWSLAWRILSKTLLAWEVSTIVQYFEHSFVLPFLGTGMMMTFSSPVATAGFSKFADLLSTAL